MRIVTLEEHVLTPAFAEARKHLYDSPPPELRALMEPAMLDLCEARLRAMDTASIDMQVLSLVAANALDGLPAHDGTTIARDANNRIGAALRAYPERFAGFATVSLTDIAAAVDEMDRAVEELGFSGVMMPDTVRGLSVDDETFHPAWAKAEQLDVPVYLHPPPPPPAVLQAYYTGLPERMSELMAIATWDWHAEAALQVLRMIVSGLFDRFPRLRIVVGHMGASLPTSIARVGSVLDIMASQLRHPVEEYFHRHFWVTTSGYFTAAAFHDALDVVGVERMLFSIDYPFSSMHRGRRFLDSLELDAEDRARLAHGNADRLFGWS